MPIKVITYSGRDSDTMPPVWVAKNPDHGVVIGASILSAATATEVGAKGVNRQPWANSPFIPCPLGDYMEAQFLFFNSKKFSAPGRPLIAGLNYFLLDCERGGDLNKLLGEKRDVKAWLSWLERYAHGEVGAIETPIGFIPRYEDLTTVFEADDRQGIPEGPLRQAVLASTWTTSSPASSSRRMPTARTRRCRRGFSRSTRSRREACWR